MGTSPRSLRSCQSWPAKKIWMLSWFVFVARYSLPHTEISWSQYSAVFWLRFIDSNHFNSKVFEDLTQTQLGSVWSGAWHKSHPTQYSQLRNPDLVWFRWWSLMIYDDHWWSMVLLDYSHAKETNNKTRTFPCWDNWGCGDCCSRSIWFWHISWMEKHGMNRRKSVNYIYTYKLYYIYMYICLYNMWINVNKYIRHSCDSKKKIARFPGILTNRNREPSSRSFPAVNSSFGPQVSCQMPRVN
jgi:hypothetical protein